MTRGVPVIFLLLRLALIALVWGCSYLLLPFLVAVIPRLIIATLVALAVGWVSRDIREID
jgi:hypothetical protein